ncbi:MAG: response regulator [Candidatus Eremiobacterota bacterium]
MSDRTYDITEIDLSKMKIMVVDPVSSTILKKTLKKEGYEVFSVPDGDTALLKIHDYMADLILLDTDLPDIDGFSLCMKLKENDKTRHIPVIFITERSKTDDMIEGFKCGCVDYIIKPFPKEEVTARVRTHLYTVYLRKEVEKQSLLKGVVEMAGATAHELNQPLAAILMTSQFLMSQLKEEHPNYKQLKRIENQTQRMAEIIKKITFITRYEVKEYIDGIKIVDIEKASEM